MELRDEILMGMQSTLDDKQIAKLKTVLDVALFGYHIEKKQYEVAIYDDSNHKLIKQYIASKRLSGLSEKSLEQYRRTVTCFLETVGKPISEIKSMDIRGFLAMYQAQKQISNRTLENYRTYLSGFFIWLVNEEIISANPMAKVTKIKEPKRKREPFSDEEMERLRANADDIRDRAMIEFLYSTGCRVSEMVELNVNKIDFYNSSTVAHGKGEKDRQVYITESAMFWLKSYLRTRTDNDNALFIGNRGRLSKEGVEYIIRKIGIKCGVNAFPHRFRHTFATNLAKRGMPVQEIQKLLGHSSISTTMVYCDINEDDVKHSHKKYAA